MADKSLAPVYDPAPDLQTPEMEKGVIINPFVDPVSSPPPIQPVSPQVFDVIINPFNGVGVSRNESNETGDSGFKYNKFYVTKVVMIPCIILMVVFSLLLVYIIMRHLRSILKLYMSVIFYALSILYFAIQIIILLLYDQVFI